MKRISGGLKIRLDENVPTVLEVGDHEVKLFAVRGEGLGVVIFQASKEVNIKGPHVVRRLTAESGREHETAKI